MISRAHRSLVVLLTMALLVAPCLSVLGPFGPGAARAQHGAHAYDGARVQLARDCHHAHHHGPAARDRHAAAADHVELGSVPAVDPAMRQSGCCRVCYGWISKKARDDLLVHKGASERPAPAAFKSAPAAILASMEPPPPGRLPFRAATSQPVGCGVPAVFARTLRYRL